MAIPTVLLLDFLTGTFSLLIFAVSLYKIFRLYQKYPFLILKMVFLSFLLGPLSTQSVTIILLLVILGHTSSLYPLLLIFYQIMYALSVLGICLYTISLISIYPHPSVQTAVWIQVFIGLLVGVSTSVVLLTLEFNFGSPGGDIFIEYSVISVVSILILIFFVILLAVRHSRFIQRLKRVFIDSVSKGNKFLSSGYAFLY